MTRRDHLQPTLILLLVPWTGFLSWIYASQLSQGLPVAALLQRSIVPVSGALLAAMVALGLWYAEARWSRRLAYSAVLLSIGVSTAAIAGAAQVLVAMSAALVLQAVAYGYGASIARWLGLDDLCGTWQGVPLLTALGWAVLIVIGLASGTAGMLTRPVMGSVVVAGVFFAAVLGRCPQQSRAGIGGPPAAAWWALGVLMLIGLVGAVAPEIRHDALAAHLPIAREFARHGALVEMRDNTASYFQINGDLLYAMAMVLIPGAELPKLMHFLAGVVACLVVYSTGARLWTPRVGLAAAAIIAGTPLLWWLGSTAYTDLWLVLFTAGALEALTLFALRPRASLALATGLLAGAAVGTKISSLLVVAPLAIAALIWMAKIRDRRARWTAAAAFALGLVVTGLYSYARSWLLAGNPVFPLLNGVFRSPYASPSNLRRFYTGFGMGRDVWDFLLLPWRVTRYPGRFVEDGNIGIVYLALFPAVLLGIVRAQATKWMAAIVIGAVIVWFLAGQYLRFLVPVLPLAALIASAGLLAGPLSRRRLMAASVSLTLGIAVASAAWVASGPWYFPLGVIRHTTSRDAYAASSVGGFRMAQFVTRALPASARIYSVGETMSYYYDRAMVSMSWYGNAFGRRLRSSIVNTSTLGEAQAVLAPAGFTHLLVNRGDPLFVGDSYPGDWPGREPFWEPGPRLLYAYREYYLFDLRADRPPRVHGPELLRNPEILPGDGGRPQHWDGVLADAPPPALGAGVRVQPGGYLVQRVPVVPGGLFVLEATARAADRPGVIPPVRARLLIEWLDANGQARDQNTWRMVAVESDWKRYAMAGTAPPGARTAAVWLAAAEGLVEFNRASFYELR